MFQSSTFRSYSTAMQQASIDGVALVMDMPRLPSLCYRQQSNHVARLGSLRGNPVNAHTVKN